MRTYSAVFFSALSLILTLLVGHTTFQNAVQCATRGLHPHFTCFLRVDCEWMWVWWLWGWEWKGARFVLKSTYFTAAEYWPTPCLPLSGICSRSYVSEGAESVGGIQKKKKTNKPHNLPTLEWVPLVAAYELIMNCGFACQFHRPLPLQKPLFFLRVHSLLYLVFSCMLCSHLFLHLHR